ncbi:hypothetical protein QMK19_03170 [Streptomyces sp. H10-C2]|uniref:hypothetical protein n=1 Tax=unclassified Streptomyces TaxID=2593676 RepID=UPI0024BA54AD|nr:MULTISPECIES: hypothetical protein [unclassified Streptomyces]MDJ0342186.1 hypothetical protein [Streptomyces sp. PH10-H1]MDJ0368700.1 hypothetical protein [Streptomyces sp. H10-C2]
MSRWKQRPRASHVEAAARMKAEPGVWMPVGSYPTSYSAKSVMKQIEAAYRLEAYLPAGSFEARTQSAGDETAVLARYIGGAS